MRRKTLSLMLALLPALLLSCPGCGDYASSSAPAAAAQDLVTKDPVIFVGGGTIDDNAASVLMFTMENLDFLGTITTNSDSIHNYAMQVQWKLQSYIGKSSYPATLSDARGWNPFPWLYRADSIKVYNADVFKGYSDMTQWPPYPSGEIFLKEQLTRAVETGTPVTLLITDPLTTLFTVLRENRQLEKGIKRMVWMGGAINVPGNLDPTTIPPEIANQKAEWNVFWDPYAVDWLFDNTTFPLILFPLDVTDQAKLTPEFMASLKAQSPQYRFSSLVYGLYSLVEGQPYFEMWNSLTSVYLARPDIFDDPVPMNLTVVTEGYMQGTVSQGQNGRAASVVLNIKDKDAFYSYALNQLKRN